MTDIKIITEAEFEQEVIQSETPVLLDFGASWCGPCRRMEPILEKVASEMTGKCKAVKIVKIDIDDADKLTSRFGVRSVPTLILFKEGKEVKRIVGLAAYDKVIGMLTEAAGDIVASPV